MKPGSHAPIQNSQIKQSLISQPSSVCMSLSLSTPVGGHSFRRPLQEATDLGLPFVGVGFLYPQGYFQQRISRDGVQEAIYDKLHFSEVPAVPAVGPDGNEVVISVELPGRRLFAKVWKLMVGRIPLYLMDTDVAPNAPHDRELSARLYGGDREMRISQEIVLGIGGVRALRALGIAPSAWHIK